MTCTREKSSILACMALASSDKEGGGGGQWMSA